MASDKRYITPEEVREYANRLKEIEANQNYPFLMGEVPVSINGTKVDVAVWVLNPKDNSGNRLLVTANWGRHHGE